MRVLVDKDILKWNDRLYNTNYMISCNEYLSHAYTNLTSQTLSIMRRESTHGNPVWNGSGTQIYSPHGNFTLIEAEDPNIKYDFVFSVSESRKDELFRILESLLKSGIVNNISYQKSRSEIKIIPQVVNIKEESHEIFNRKYIRYSYHFEGKLTSIISYITIIEDSIEFFQKLWGYDEKGNEYCLIKYPIGTMVSKIEDKSKDFMIMDYGFKVTTNLIYDISYIISEIVGDSKSLVIKYKGLSSLGESKLTYSRNNRIDNILN